ncbi:MAG: flagellar hook-basal body complex protein FliE [Betaproteobacteria bacterium]|nr:flagellar hook-basal body complex protein FliE [Betaproteobacteria bacterium]
MSIANEIQAVKAAADLSIPLQTPIVQRTGGGDFGNLVAQGLQKLNGQLLRSEVDLQRLAVGDVQNLHEVMIRMEETQLSFHLFMQARNRLLEAYQDVMKMQV